MKAQERHHLKQNEFAATTARVMDTLAANRDRVVMVAIAVVVVIAVAGGYLFWRNRTNEQAGALLGVATSIVQAPIVPAPTVPGATQQPGTYPTEAARRDAAMQAFQQVATAYPSTEAGLAARYHIASMHLAGGQFSEAEQAFRAVADSAGSSIYSPMARMGVAQALVGQAKYDDGIKLLTDLSADRDGALPVDGVLMELARVCVKAGKTQEARAAFKRVVDEFPESNYAAEARQRLTVLG